MRMKGKKAKLIAKIDLEKAFANIEWSFIRNTLTLFNFSSNIINLKMSCISTSKISILLNGSRTNYFKPSREIVQGDPISPYIFILCMEMLSRCIEEQVPKKKKWIPIKISGRGPSLSHLFFADDLLLLGKTSKENCNTINETIRHFYLSLGQVVNSNKSKLILSKNCPEILKNEISSLLGIKNGRHFGKYLGFQISHQKRSGKDFQCIKNKIVGWKTKFLNIAGRTTLAKACLNKISTHVMKISKLPKSITNKIDQIQRNFISSSTNDKRKIYLVKWEVLATRRSEGGVGIQLTNKRKMALLAKLA